MQAATGAALSLDERRHQHRVNQRWVLVIATVWVALDQASKIWAESTLAGTEPVRVLGEVLQLRLVYNSGAAFSLGTGNTWVFTILATVVIGVLGWQSRRLDARSWALAIGLLIGGAGGNLVDRLLRAPGFGRGHVVDFLALPNFPVFNVADIGITTAAVLIGILVLRGDAAEGSGADPAGPEINYR